MSMAQEAISCLTCPLAPRANRRSQSHSLSPFPWSVSGFGSRLFVFDRGRIPYGGQLIASTIGLQPCSGVPLDMSSPSSS
jgi:hypothetical protein